MNQFNDQFKLYAAHKKEPWFKRLSDCQLKEITINTSTPEDEYIFKTKGVAELRKHRLKYIHTQCKKQNVLLSYGQIARILGVSIKTIGRYIRDLGDIGIIIRTRGKNLDYDEEKESFEG